MACALMYDTLVILATIFVIIFVIYTLEYVK